MKKIQCFALLLTCPSLIFAHGSSSIHLHFFEIVAATIIFALVISNGRKFLKTRRIK